jgi:hypothetical protein
MFNVPLTMLMFMFRAELISFDNQLWTMKNLVILKTQMVLCETNCLLSFNTIKLTAWDLNWLSMLLIRTDVQCSADHVHVYVETWTDQFWKPVLNYEEFFYPCRGMRNALFPFHPSLLSLNPVNNAFFPAYGSNWNPFKPSGVNV